MFRMVIAAQPIKFPTVSVTALTCCRGVLSTQYQVMAYSPLGGASSTLLRDPTLAVIGAAHGCSAAAVALAWTIRDGNVIAIPESGNVAHVKENAVALSLALTSEELQALDAAHPVSSR